MPRLPQFLQGVVTWYKNRGLIPPSASRNKVFFLRRRYSLLSFRLPQRILIDITYQLGGSANHLFSMLCFCRISWQTLQPILLCYSLYSAKGSLSHRQRPTGLNAGLTRGKLHHTQTQTTHALDRSAVWAELRIKVKSTKTPWLTQICFMPISLTCNLKRFPFFI